MKWLMPIVIVGAVVLLGFQSASRPSSSAAMQEGSAATYEQLATAIIAIRNTETNLVKGILMHSYATAQRECQAALDVDGPARVARLEAAAREITNVASEGDKGIQAVRQRLLEAGHHHHTDAETQDDYIFIDSVEKKEFIDLANGLARLGPTATDDAIHGAMKKLGRTFEASMQED